MPSRTTLLPHQLLTKLRLHLHDCIMHPPPPPVCMWHPAMQVEGASASATMHLMNKGHSLDGFHVHEDRSYVVTAVMRAPKVGEVQAPSCLTTPSPAAACS